MDSIEIHKYKNIDINKLNINDFSIEYNNNNFYLQSPIFYDYEILNHNSKKYIELKLDDNKVSHINFLTFIDSLELKLNKYISKDIGKEINKSNILKTQIITNIQNKKSLKVKLDDNTVYFNKEKIQIDKLNSNKISLLLKIEFYRLYYSFVSIQILQLN